MKNRIHEKGYRNKPLTDEQKENNTENQKLEQEWSMYLILWSKA
jgi:hypothetical protein